MNWDVASCAPRTQREAVSTGERAIAFFDPSRNPPATSALDRFIRRFSALSYGVATLAMYVIAASALGLALVPSLLVMARAWPPLWSWSSWLRWPVLGVLTGASLFLWGFSLLVVVPLFNLLLPTKLRSFKGGYFTIAALPWYVHNGLFYVVRFTFLPFVTLTPFGILFLKAMGMKLGQRVRIGTENFSDPCLITIGDDSALGGSCHIFCHYGGGGHLVIAPVVIGARVTIGLKATLMGDVQVGDEATVLAHTVLLPGTRVGPGEVWGGVPGRMIPKAEWEAYKTSIRTGGETA